MRIIFEITHPAHVHFFRNPIRILEEDGHELLVTSRDKDCTLDLLSRYDIENHCLSQQSGNGVFAMARELIKRNRALLRLARQFGPDVLTGIGGVCAAQVGRLLRKQSVIFYDTETARLQNLLTYPFATRIVVPDCYKGTLPEQKAVRYRGYHELSYLHPDHFTPSRETALANGLAPKGDTFLVRVVSWKASHDVGLKGWSGELLDTVTKHLCKRGHVVISAEGELPNHLEPLRYSGDPGQIHHVIAHCRACIGESATMSSEAAVLGVPAIYVATESRGYIDEQAERYQMASTVPIQRIDEVLAAIDQMLNIPLEEVKIRHRKLLENTVDVARMVTSQITHFSNS